MRHNHFHCTHTHTQRFEKFKASYSVLHKTVNSRTRKSTELEKTLKNLNQTLLAEKIKLERQNIARLEEDQIVSTLIREKEHVRFMLPIRGHCVKMLESRVYAHFVNQILCAIVIYLGFGEAQSGPTFDFITRRLSAFRH